MPISLSEDLTENSKEVSIYGKGRVNSKVFADGIIKIKKAFPKLQNGWYDILEEMLDVTEFTDKRFIDAVNNLIRTCQYPEPTIGNVLSFDKKTKLYDYYELLKMSAEMSNQERGRFWEMYEIKDKEKKLWGLKRG